MNPLKIMVSCENITFMKNLINAVRKNMATTQNLFNVASCAKNRECYTACINMSTQWQLCLLLCFYIHAVIILCQFFIE